MITTYDLNITHRGKCYAVRFSEEEPTTIYSFDKIRYTLKVQATTEFGIYGSVHIEAGGGLYEAMITKVEFRSCLWWIRVNLQTSLREGYFPIFHQQVNSAFVVYDVLY